jgi:cytochrome c oxidase subunit 3
MSKSASHKLGHKFHLVNPSPWPISISFALLLVTSGSVMLFHQYPFWEYVLPIGIMATIAILYFWWRDVVREGIQDHAHTDVVRKGLSLGMLLFILSEVMFFFAFFWSFFKASLDPVAILEGVWPIKASLWPPQGIEVIDPWNIPFLNTLILLLSGTTVTWAHYSLLDNNRKDMVSALLITVLLGALFTSLQVYEYFHATFKFKDGIYPSNFYMATGFHGFHVLVGTIFLVVCYFRARAGHFDKGKGHLGFEFASWYWHFVDVVWLFLFTFIYVWGS